jgi:hypothetical protein
VPSANVSFVDRLDEKPRSLRNAAKSCKIRNSRAIEKAMPTWRSSSLDFYLADLLAIAGLC